MSSAGPTTGAAVKRPNLTDAGNAARFALQHREWARYVYAWRRWLLWSGQCWRLDPGDGAMRMAKATAEGIYLEAGGAREDEERKQIAKWAIASESEPRLRAMLSLAASEPGVPVAPEELDADAWLLACQNGTVELRTGTLRANRREDLITRSVPVVFDPAAPCPTFDAFLERIFAGNARVIAFLQRAIGYSLTGDTTEQCLFVLWGGGSNGKSTLLTTAVTMLGEYAVSTRPETFMVKTGDTIPNDVAQLKGARLVIAVEAEAGHRLAEGLIKQATGGDRLTARFMRAEYFTFEPTFKIFLASNHRPTVRGTDHAIWRRIKLLPFSVTIPDDQQDRHLVDKLKAELAGVLAWAVRGCLAWQKQGLGEPEEVRAATERYRVDMDVLGGFLRDCCVTLDPATCVASGPLYQAYDAWCHANGERTISKRAFGLRLIERGFTQARTREERRWQGLRLRTAMDPSGDAPTSVTDGDTASPLESHTRARKELRGNTSHVTSPAAQESQEQLPGWVTEGSE
jgi:putative DNA primase/helicase